MGRLDGQAGVAAQGLGTPNAGATSLPAPPRMPGRSTCSYLPAARRRTRRAAYGNAEGLRCGARTLGRRSTSASWHARRSQRVAVKPRADAGGCAVASLAAEKDDHILSPVNWVPPLSSKEPTSGVKHSNVETIRQIAAEGHPFVAFVIEDDCEASLLCQEFSNEHPEGKWASVVWEFGSVGKCAVLWRGDMVAGMPQISHVTDNSGWVFRHEIVCVTVNIPRLYDNPVVFLHVRASISLYAEQNMQEHAALVRELARQADLHQGLVLAAGDVKYDLEDEAYASVLQQHGVQVIVSGNDDAILVKAPDALAELFASQLPSWGYSLAQAPLTAGTPAVMSGMHSPRGKHVLRWVGVSMYLAVLQAMSLLQWLTYPMEEHITMAAAMSEAAANDVQQQPEATLEPTVQTATPSPAGVMGTGPESSAPWPTSSKLVPDGLVKQPEIHEHTTQAFNATPGATAQGSFNTINGPTPAPVHEPTPTPIPLPSTTPQSAPLPEPTPVPESRPTPTHPSQSTPRGPVTPTPEFSCPPQPTRSVVVHERLPNGRRLRRRVTISVQQGSSPGKSADDKQLGSNEAASSPEPTIGHGTTTSSASTTITGPVDAACTSPAPTVDPALACESMDNLQSVASSEAMPQNEQTLDEGWVVSEPAAAATEPPTAATGAQDPKSGIMSSSRGPFILTRRRHRPGAAPLYNDYKPSSSRCSSQAAVQPDAVLHADSRTNLVEDPEAVIRRYCRPTEALESFLANMNEISQSRYTEPQQGPTVEIVDGWALGDTRDMPAKQMPQLPVPTETATRQLNDSAAAATDDDSDDDGENAGVVQQQQQQQQQQSVNSSAEAPIKGIGEHPVTRLLVPRPAPARLTAVTSQGNSDQDLTAEGTTDNANESAKMGTTESASGHANEGATEGVNESDSNSDDEDASESASASDKDALQEAEMCPSEMLRTIRDALRWVRDTKVHGKLMHAVGSQLLDKGERDCLRQLDSCTTLAEVVSELTRHSESCWNTLRDNKHGAVKAHNQLYTGRLYAKAVLRKCGYFRFRDHSPTPSNSQVTLKIQSLLADYQQYLDTVQE